MVVRFHHAGDESRAKTFTVEPVAGTNNVWRMRRPEGERRDHDVWYWTVLVVLEAV